MNRLPWIAVALCVIATAGAFKSALNAKHEVDAANAARADLLVRIATLERAPAFAGDQSNIIDLERQQAALARRIAALEERAK